MKVLLAATNRERSPYPVAPLGVLCVAAAARAAGHELKFLDLGVERKPQKALKHALAKEKFGAVAFGIRVYEEAPIADVAVREGQVKPDQDLFEPAYYLSPGLAEDTENKLDRIARRRAEWTSPADWRKTVVRYGQKVSVLLNVRPTWKYISSYGRHVRRTIP